MTKRKPLPQRPGIRAQCEDGPRPCPWVGCVYHLYLDVLKTGGIHTNWDGPPWTMSETCALDVAARGGVTLNEIGVMIGVSRERIRQIEFAALRKLKKKDQVNLVKADFFDWMC